MTDIDITKKVEQEEMRKKKADLEAEALQSFSLEKEPETRAKTMIILIAVLVGLFVIFFFGSKWWASSATAAVVTIDDLHQQNLAGKLNEDEGYLYNGYSFVKSDGLWWTEMNKFGTRLKVPLHFGPRDLTEVKVTGTLNSSFNEPLEVFVAIDPLVRDKYYTLAVSELSVNLAQGFDRVPIGSCTTEDYRCENRTIVNCDDTPGKPAIELAQAPGPQIELRNWCIQVQGQEPYDLVKAVDRLLLQWYGVMK